jgi:hypothetical protein
MESGAVGAGMGGGGFGAIRIDTASGSGLRAREYSQFIFDGGRSRKRAFFLGGPKMRTSNRWYR